MALTAVRDLRELRAPATENKLGDFETGVLSGFVLARASAGLVDSTIRNDVNHLELIRDWFGRPLWEMQPPDADTYFGKVLRDANPSTRTGRASALTSETAWSHLRERPLPLAPTALTWARCDSTPPMRISRHRSVEWRQRGRAP